MLDEINNLIKRIYEEQGEKRRLELQVLQAQIKPHFLYNTLDNVKWMAKEYGAEDIARTVTALSTFFRVFLSEGEEEISLEDEFRHTRSYLEIQQIRYGQLLSYETKLDESLAGARVIKIIVQPLVENAIYHGIKNKRQKGHIIVSARAAPEGIDIVVSDDGIGMDGQVLEGIRASIKAAEGGSGDALGHYGLRNIAERLRLAYGEKAGIEIESVEGEGTKVTMHLPRVGKGEKP
jgi:two-component system sensor histidine kinase YesM